MSGGRERKAQPSQQQQQMLAMQRQQELMGTFLPDVDSTWHCPNCKSNTLITVALVLHRGLTHPANNTGRDIKAAIPSGFYCATCHWSGRENQIVLFSPAERLELIRINEALIAQKLAGGCIDTKEMG